MEIITIIVQEKLHQSTSSSRDAKPKNNTFLGKNELILPLFAQDIFFLLPKITYFFNLFLTSNLNFFSKIFFIFASL